MIPVLPRFALLLALQAFTCQCGWIDPDTPLDKRTTTSFIDGTVYHLVRAMHWLRYLIACLVIEWLVLLDLDTRGNFRSSLVLLVLASQFVGSRCFFLCVHYFWIVGFDRAS